MSKGGKTIKTVKKFLAEAQKEKISNVIWHDVASGAASTGPPLGPMLGQRGIPIAKFVKDFNEKTKHMKKGIPIPTRITIDGRNYDIQINSPTIEYMIRQAAGLTPNLLSREGAIIGKITYKHVYEIAKIKKEDDYYVIRDYTLQQMCEEISTVCYELGIEVVHSYDSIEYEEFVRNVDLLEEEFQQQRLEAIEAKKKKL